MIANKLIRALALLGVFAAALAPVTPVSAGGGLKVYFKLDSRLTQSLYMGERLVAPDLFTSAVVEGAVVAIEAEARSPDAIGDPRPIAATFTAADAARIGITPAGGDRVTLSINGCSGPSTVTVSGAGLSTLLTVTPICGSDTIYAEIAQ